MPSISRTVVTLAGAFVMGACSEPAGVPGAPAPSLARDAAPQQHTVVVNADASGNGVAATIQEAIDRVQPGGRVLVRPGIYPEALVIPKGVTIEGIGDGSGPAIIAPPGTQTAAIEVATLEPVTLRDLTIHVPGAIGVRGVGPVDLTVERSIVLAVDPPPGASNLIFVLNDGGGGRARLVVRHSTIDGTITDRPLPFPQSFGLRPHGDVDAVFEGNVIRRTGGACIFVVVRSDLGGVTNADIVNNDLDECHPAGRVASILIGPLAVNVPSATRPITATGIVNIVGNTIRNTAASCLPAAAILYETFTGRIEHNRILQVVQPCATGGPRTPPGAISIGSVRPFFASVNPTVKFNDIVGNARAGLFIARNITATIDARCNWWGSASGPSGVGQTGSGDAVVVETGAAAPTVAPFATAPIAATGASTCD